MSAIDKAAAIAALNDEFRSYVGMPPYFAPNTVRGKVVQTRGISALPPVDQITIWALVRDYNAFTPDNDIRGQHDFGAVELHGKPIFWKFYDYDKAMEQGSEDPSDPAQTSRVLTIMLASEW